MSDTPHRAPLPGDITSRPWFFCGIGGSGMLPLATILKQSGAHVAGSDRSFDQGRSADKFAALESTGFVLFSQDGSGITDKAQILVASAAIEDRVPDIAKARALGCVRVSRAQLNAHLFNRAGRGLAVAGTSGKSTVTAMIGWIMTHAGHDPTIMNGAVMKNFVAPDNPLASARFGKGALYISEVDESDGSIALYHPDIAVLTNVTLDHKSLDELRALFAGYLDAAGMAVVNSDEAEVRGLTKSSRNVLSFGIEAQDADIGVEQGSIVKERAAIGAKVVDRRVNQGHPLHIAMPGRHNLSNALAAVTACMAAGVTLAEAASALGTFAGLARRFDIIGTSASGITVIDDFAHNPDKARATLVTLKTMPGRVIALFQPHGYGPLRQMGDELAATIASQLDEHDLVILTDPAYFGGTVDRSEGSERIVRRIVEQGGNAEHIATREAAADRIVVIARPGDRVVVMGARDDTLADFAKDLLARLE